MQIIPNNLTLENISDNLRYSFIFADFIFVFGFSFAVIMAIINKNNIAIHARYMISTVFWVLLPALSRLIYFPILISYGFPTPISFLQCVYIAGGLILLVLCLLILIDFLKERTIYKPYLIVTITTIIVLLSWNYFGYTEWWRAFCHALLK